jgi:hypothetical protein
MKIRHFFAFGFCILTLGFTGLYAQEMGEVDEAIIEEESESQPGQAVSEAPQKKPNFFVRTANFFMHLPFGYDLGCEPTLHGSLTYFNLKYRWSDEKQIFSRLLFNYGTTLDISHNSFTGVPSSYISKFEKEDKAVDFKLIPWGKQINVGLEKKSYFTIEPGLNFRMEFENVDVTLKKEGRVAAYPNEDILLIYDISERGKRYIIRPYYSTSFYLPVSKIFSVTVDALYAPLYFYRFNIDVNIDVNYYKRLESSTVIPSANVSIRDTVKGKGFAENYFDTNLVFSLFNAFAVSGRFMYERKHTDEYELNNELKFQTATSNKYDKLSLKFGGSLINIGKADMRIKTGVFYQWDWSYNHNADSWEKEGKWIFGVGMRNLY